MARADVQQGALSSVQLTLYHMAPTRSTRAVWLVHELGIACDIDIRQVNLQSAEHKQGRLLEMNRMGAIPILHVLHKASAQETVVTESAAICDFLLALVSDKQRAKLMPTGDEVLASAVYKRFFVFAAASMDPLLWTIRRNEELLSEEKRDVCAAREARDEFERRVVPVLEEQLRSAQYLCEPFRDGFSAADIMVGYALAWAARYALLQSSATLQAYLRRVSTRDAFRMAIASSGM